MIDKKYLYLIANIFVLVLLILGVVMFLRNYCYYENKFFKVGENVNSSCSCKSWGTVICNEDAGVSSKTEGDMGDELEDDNGSDKIEIKDLQDKVTKQNTSESNYVYLNPSNYKEKEKLTKNDDYTVWLIDVDGEEDFLRTGKFLVENNKMDEEENAVLIQGEVEVFGTANIRNIFEEGRYLLITAGTYTSQDGYALDLKKGEIIDEICLDTGKQFYHKGFIYYTNCDIQSNRPYGSGEAPSVVELNVNTHKSKILYQSDDLQDFEITKIENDTLYVKRTYVKLENDWDNEKTFTEVVMKDL